MKKLTPILIALITTFTTLSAAAQELIIKKLSENVYSAFIYHYQSLIVVGNEGVLITDPANSVRAKLLKSEISKLTALPIKKIILTHEHYDHVGGTEVFPEAQIYAHKAVESVFRLDVTNQAPKEVNHYVGDKTTIAMGITNVELLHYGAADGVGMLAIHLPKEKVVFTADLYEVGRLTERQYLADSNFLGSRSILNSLVSLSPKFAITTHSENIDPKHLNLAANFYNDLYNEVKPRLLKAMSEGWSSTLNALDSLPKEITLPKYSNLKNYNHLPAHVERMVFSIFHGG